MYSTVKHSNIGTSCPKSSLLLKDFLLVTEKLTITHFIRIKVLIWFFVSSSIITKAQTISTENIIASNTCSGQFIIVTYSTTGNFNWGNQFRVEMSNNLGIFNNPTVIGFSPFNLGAIPAQVPYNIPPGIYRMRVVSTNPSVIGSPALTPLLITNISQATQIFITPNDSACTGDSIRLAVAPIFSANWSTGETTTAIYVKNSGKYWVKTTDAVGCEGRDTVTVHFYSCNLNQDNSDSNFEFFNLYPNPAHDRLFVVSSLKTTSLNWSIMNLQGQILRSGLLWNGFLELVIDNLNPGIYILKFEGQDNFWLTRLFIKVN